MDGLDAAIDRLRMMKLLRLHQYEVHDAYEVDDTITPHRLSVGEYRGVVSLQTAVNDLHGRGIIHLSGRATNIYRPERISFCSDVYMNRRCGPSATQASQELLSAIDMASK